MPISMRGRGKDGRLRSGARAAWSFALTGAALAVSTSAAAEIACGTPTFDELSAIYFMGATSGIVTVTYNMYSAPDQLDIYYGNTLLATTGGLVSDTEGSPLTFHYTPEGDDFTVSAVVTPSSGSAWEFVIGCPGDGIGQLTSSDRATTSSIIASQSLVVQQIAQTQARNFTRRLDNLRHGTGGGRVSFSGLTLNYNGVALPAHFDAGRHAFSERVLQASARQNRLAALNSNEWSSGSSLPDAGGWGDGPMLGGRQDWRDAWLRRHLSDDRSASDVAEIELPDRLGVFVNGVINVGDHDTTGTSSGFDFKSVGISFGVDYRLTADLVVGVGGGFNSGNTHIAGGSKSDVKSLSFTTYGSWRPIESAYVDGLVSYTSLDFDLERAVAGTPVRAYGDRDGRQVSASITGGYEFTGDAFTYGPYLRLNLARTWLDGFTETGAGPGNLQFEGERLDSLTGVLGFRADYAFSTSSGILSPYLRTEYEHEFAGANNPAIVRFAGLPGSDTAIAAAPVDRNFFHLGGGVVFLMENAVSLFFDYETLLGFADQSSHLITAGVTARF